MADGGGPETAATGSRAGGDDDDAPFGTAAGADVSAARPRTVRLSVVALVAAVVLIAAVAALAALGTFRGTAPAFLGGPGTRCATPALPGRVVDVTAADTGWHMMHGPRHPGWAPVDGGRPGRYGPGTMRLIVRPAAVPAGTVSIRVFNAGSVRHEVVVVPLPSGRAVGERPVGGDGRIAETGAVGEASRTCGPGTGDGIAPGAAGWTTLTLRPGRYELVCNLPGHYASGMYTELDVGGR